MGRGIKQVLVSAPGSGRDSDVPSFTKMALTCQLWSLKASGCDVAASEFTCLLELMDTCPGSHLWSQHKCESICLLDKVASTPLLQGSIRAMMGMICLFTDTCCLYVQPSS